MILFDRETRRRHRPRRLGLRPLQGRSGMSDPVLGASTTSTKFFGPVGKGVHAVKDICMEVARGDIVALLGLLRLRQDVDPADDRRVRERPAAAAS